MRLIRLLAALFAITWPGGVFAQQYESPVIVIAAGSTAAITATMAADTSPAVRTNYLCGFDVEAFGGTAESVEITYDAKQISFGRLLQIYFSVAHDPTQLNRQGPDEGTQYRAEIFANSDAQQLPAKAYIAELDKAHAYAGRIATKVEPLQVFYPAEPYHQDYATLHPGSLYIAVYDLPKIANLKRLYQEFYRELAVLVGDSRQ